MFFVPSFRFNLISISQLTNSTNCDVVFSLSICYFQDRTLKTKIGQGKAQYGLYFLENDITPLFAFTFRTCNKMELCHSRLGHPSTPRLHFILKLFSGLEARNKFQCTMCPRAKQLRLSFNKSTSSSQNYFQLLHMDIWGPFTIPSQNGSHYFLTIVDDFSRCT